MQVPQAGNFPRHKSNTYVKETSSLPSSLHSSLLMLMGTYLEDDKHAVSYPFHPVTLSTVSSFVVPSTSINPTVQLLFNSFPTGSFVEFVEKKHTYILAKLTWVEQHKSSGYSYQVIDSVKAR
jgi:hypothetical protein